MDTEGAPAGCSSSEIGLDQSFTAPIQTDPRLIPFYATKNGKLYFQAKWYSDFPWLSYSEKEKGVLCFSCVRSASLGLAKLSKSSEPAFMQTGFRNWKKALECFRQHENSAHHKFSVQQLAQQKAPIDALLSSKAISDQARARMCLNKIFTTIQFLARQGLPFRGHAEDEGNFMKLLQLRCDDIPELSIKNSDWPCI